MALPPDNKPDHELIRYLSAGRYKHFRTQRQLPERTRLYRLILLGVGLLLAGVIAWTAWRELL